MILSLVLRMYPMMRKPRASGDDPGGGDDAGGVVE